ncbi:hypothetical protein DdX_08379 [Ditylenchus destructor]|uniref:Uncharacterized protein n=1 Tax=Ditylenchus destructor TaxID=166010 RepID=A0AAD4N379_9BILA|nr:hypothetical protein DdX_08379 [Ditylenchus destructor]
MKDVCLLDSGLKTRLPDLDNFKTYNWKVLCRAYKINRDCVVPFLRSKCGDKAAERTIAELMIHFTMYEAIVENELNMEWPQDCRDLASADAECGRGCSTVGDVVFRDVVYLHFWHYIPENYDYVAFPEFNQF